MASGDRLGLVMQSAIMDVEATPIASKAHYVDDLIYYNNTVYRVTSYIAQGDALEPGLNISTTKLGTQISAKANKSFVLSLYTDATAGPAASVSFDGAIPGVASLTINFTGLQSGSGTPSPGNIRPFVQRQSVDFTANGASRSVSMQNRPSGASLPVAGIVSIAQNGTAGVRVCAFYSSYAGEPLVGPWLCDRAVYSSGSTPPTGSAVVDLGRYSAQWALKAPVISVLSGANTFAAAETGDTISVTYQLRKLDEQVVATPFSTSASYAVGAYVIYDGALYLCTTAHTGAWDASHFTAVTVGDELSAKAPLASPALTGNPTAPTQSAGNNSTRIATTAFVQRAAGNSVAPLFSSSDSYAVGAYVMYGGALYRCTTAHTGAWDASHFTAVTVGGDIASYLPTLFAPAGFGIGTTPVTFAPTDNIDNVTLGGLYFAGLSASGKPQGELPFANDVAFGLLVIPLGTANTLAAAQIAVRYTFDTTTDPVVKVRVVRNGSSYGWRTLAFS